MRQEDVRARYQDAVETLCDKLKRDSHVLAAILWGSLAYDQVWDKSDIDMYIVMRDEKMKPTSYVLVENDVFIHAQLYPRNSFKKMLEGRSIFFQSTIELSTLLFSHDETIEQFYVERGQKIGAKDRENALIREACGLFPTLVKAEKWHYVKNDVEYAFMWLMWVVESLARIEVISRGEIVRREVIHQAIQFNPDFFNAIYTDLIHQPKTAEANQAALDAVNGYIEKRVDDIFESLFQFLAEAHGPRSMREINDRFRRVAQTGMTSACEWLSDRGYIDKVSAPMRLVKGSRVNVEEAAFYFDEEMRF